MRPGVRHLPGMHKDPSSIPAVQQAEKEQNQLQRQTDPSIYLKNKS